MVFEKELTSLKLQKDTVISTWFTYLDNYSSNKYIFSELEVHAHNYFDFLIDFNISVESHPVYEAIQMYCEIVFLRKRPLPYMLAIFKCWETAFIHILLKSENPKEALACMEMILARNGAFEHKFFELYGQNSIMLMNEKDTKIEMLHNDRMNLIGKMASSIAHEIRNPLTAIQGFLKLIRSNLSKGTTDKTEKYMDIIENEFELINMQITGLLSFSKNRITEESYMEVSVLQLIEAIFSLLNPRIMNEDIHLTISCENDFFLKVQKIAIHQVLFNIINNAIDALSVKHDEKEIRILCKEDNDNYYIQIINNGPEIQKEIRDTLFLPFITNKEEGTGLGLAICNEIMNKNNGEINFITNSVQTNFILSFKK
ncbi:sensor histidine kinase [Paenibacillus sp. Soil522]|uniref:sensor histidine kinase n=1 Tax=Paenibacillus sp. Soil522 TaxID=1736388 RepID=UPI0006F72521|nr:HAMP domain-containing sensor histidine kinase [Paenibacillus sp. Soil522]KRE40303.1 hypothetical protein ASG81_17390 [Paenibacillus sp. Soil522]